MTKKEARKFREDYATAKRLGTAQGPWARAVEEGRVVRLTETSFRSYPTVEAASEGLREALAAGLPARIVGSQA